MRTQWGLAVDCADPAKLTDFWALALGYVKPGVPAGFASWEEWFDHYDVPEDERDDGGYLVDPDGVGPTLSFLKVPEGKAVKNRLHIDVKVGGGRDDVPWEVRWPRVLEAKERLVAAGATVVKQYDFEGRGDHFWMEDPEGNEFCLV
jgi:glyoxalase superfamily protein